MSTPLDLLTAGAIGPVRPDMTFEDVLAALGTPAAVSTRRRPKVLKYGPMQVAFARHADGTERVGLVSVSMANRQSLSPELAALPLSRAELLGVLATHGIVPESDTTDDVDQVLLPSGVRFVFDAGTLHSVHVTARKPPVKQLSVSIPLETYHALEKLAAGQKHSRVQEVASTILTEQAKVHSTSN